MYVQRMMGFMQRGYTMAATAVLGLLMVVLLWISLLQRRKTSNFPPGMVSSMLLFFFYFFNPCVFVTDLLFDDWIV